MNKKIMLTIIAILLISTIITGCTETINPNIIKEETIRIGTSLPLTGKGATYGKWERQGLELAVSEINAKGGIQGKTIELIIDDNEFKTEKALNIINKFVYMNNLKMTYSPT